MERAHRGSLSYSIPWELGCCLSHSQLQGQFEGSMHKFTATSPIKNPIQDRKLNKDYFQHLHQTWLWKHDNVSANTEFGGLTAG